ncbi:META domain-containing protein [Ferruginibacter sp. HRS2-29]|uniref:META domain-containing protein n=1 Tax=Ferruginibacter sp. HRS2-29 TaxID=2487334 RepID=UPI0020CBC2DE|nr:META domain-containing protein [Ferruginibacter sp. HRS2-29]MCP9753371.1 META domain-containing protein [Ferruginibacter sp. HRS2-29]
MHPLRYILYSLFLMGLFTACNSSRETAIKKTEAEQLEIKLPDSLLQKQADGIDFFAEGNQPISWKIDMDIDKGYYFKASNGISFEIPAVKPSRNSDIAANSYSYSSRQGDMSVLVFDQSCAGTSGKKVEVTVNGTRYSGCGKDLYNNAINDTWILEKNDNQILHAKDFPHGLPKIVFTIAENKMTGSDGCSDISSSIRIQGSRISFSTITGGNGSCKNNSIRRIFMEKLSNKTADYYFRNGRLYLYLIDDSTLEFRKA